MDLVTLDRFSCLDNVMLRHIAFLLQICLKPILGAIAEREN